MFEIGFSELVMVALVALLVFGPERLPKVARMAGMWLGRARRTLNTVQQEINRELKTQELKEILNRPANQILDNSLANSKASLNQTIENTPSIIEEKRQS